MTALFSVEETVDEVENIVNIVELKLTKFKNSKWRFPFVFKLQSELIILVTKK